MNTYPAEYTDFVNQFCMRIRFSVMKSLTGGVVGRSGHISGQINHVPSLFPRNDGKKKVCKGEPKCNANPKGSDEGS